MPDSVHDVVKSLLDSKILREQDLPGNLEQVPDGDVEQLTGDLLRRRKLTAYQCQAIRNGRTRDLVIGQYVLLDKIGEGGMGQVYKAQHIQTNSILALKVLTDSTAESEEAVKRFQREMQVGAILHHANIVMSHDMGEVSGVRYLALEYVDGLDLSSHVKMDGPVSSHRAADYILQAARGLAHAHEEGVIHRDIKPSNLLLDRRGMVKILDLGLAKFADDADGLEELNNERLTMQDQMMGTVDYMSPEQAMDTHNANFQSDIYSLGCTLYFILTGEPMYDGDTSIAKLMAHMEQPIPSLREKVADATESLDSAFQRMVAKQPEDRHPSMADVISDLEACLEEFGGPIYADQTAEQAAPEPPAAAAQTPAPAPSPPETPPTSVPAEETPPPTQDTSSKRPPRPPVRRPQPGVSDGVGLPSVIYPPSMTEELRRRADDSKSPPEQDQPSPSSPMKDEDPSVISAPRPQAEEPAQPSPVQPSPVQPSPAEPSLERPGRKTVPESPGAPEVQQESASPSPAPSTPTPQTPQGGLGSSDKTVVSGKTTVEPRARLTPPQQTAPPAESLAGQLGGDSAESGSLLGKVLQGVMFMAGAAIIIALAVQFALGLLK